MTLNEQIEFYRHEYQTTKTLKMALVTFGAYMALVQLSVQLRGRPHDPNIAGDLS